MYLHAILPILLLQYYLRSVYGTAPYFTSAFNAVGKTLNLTIANLDANSSNPNGDSIAKVGLGVSHGGTSTIGTLNLTMLDLPRGSTFRELFEHYGVVAGLQSDGTNSEDNECS
jgi:hypothetical protein